MTRTAMRHPHMLMVPIPEELFLELVDAAAECYQPDEDDCTPEQFARELIETGLATRRLDRICAV